VVVIAVLTVAFVAKRGERRRQGHPVAVQHQHVLAGLLAVFVFVAGPTILIPSLVSLLWFAIFGGGGGQPAALRVDLAARSPEEQLFGVLDAYPLGVALGVVAMLLVRRAGQGAAQRPRSCTATTGPGRRSRAPSSTAPPSGEHFHLRVEPKNRD